MEWKGSLRNIDRFTNREKSIAVYQSSMCQLTNRKEKELKEKFLKEQIKGKRTSFSVVKKTTVL